MKTQRILFVTSLGLFVIAATLASEKASPEIDAIHRWLFKRDAGEYERCWNDGAKLMHEVVPLDQWTDFQKKQAEVFGKLIKREMIGTATHNRFLRPNGTTIEAEFFETKFKSVFKSRPLVVESISAIKEADGEWRIFAYDARPYARE